MLLAAGEQISISLLAMAIEKLGYPAVSLLGWQAGFETTNIHTSARIKKVDPSRIRHELDKKELLLLPVSRVLLKQTISQLSAEAVPIQVP